MNARPPSRADYGVTVFGVPVLRTLGWRQIRVGVFIFVAFLAATRITGGLFVAPAVVYPAAGIAIGALFLEGVFLWPFVYSASVLGYVLDGGSLATVLGMPIALTILAVLGAKLLKRLGVDPILRRGRDIFSIIFVAFLSATIVPTFAWVMRAFSVDLHGAPLGSVSWFSGWTALVLSILIFTPFVLRWFAKPHFSRTLPQMIEVLLTLGGTAAIAYFLFWTEFTEINGTSLTYALFLPLFWIALRIGPRFLTLALLILSTIAISGVFFTTNPELVGESLLRTEIFLTIFAIIFFVVVTIEEERRMATKLLTSQIGSLRTALDQLAEQDKAKNEFIAVVAHELRNPLTPVMASLDLLKERLKDSEDQKTLSFMGNCMLTARRLLEDLLDASRADQKKLVLEQEVTDLAKVVRHAAASRQHTLKDRNQTFTLSVPDTTFCVQGDPVRLEQVVMNLLVNASKFTDPGGRITLTLSKDEEHARIDITDSGVGIAPTMIEKIFEPFTQVENGSRKGLGIGLALAKQLVEAHGGRISAMSKGLGHGSTFRVEIPLIPQAAPLEATVPPKKAPASVKVSRGTVLIVDDNDAAAYSVGRLLELKGFQVSYAYDGTHALEQAIELSPTSSILLDIGLPDIDGFTVAKELRARGYAGNLVALTGYSSEEERAKAVEAGFNHHLVKPVGIAELRRVL